MLSPGERWFGSRDCGLLGISLRTVSETLRLLFTQSVSGYSPHFFSSCQVGGSLPRPMHVPRWTHTSIRSNCRAGPRWLNTRAPPSAESAILQRLHHPHVVDVRRTFMWSEKQILVIEEEMLHGEELLVAADEAISNYAFQMTESFASRVPPPPRTAALCPHLPR